MWALILPRVVTDHLLNAIVAQCSALNLEFAKLTGFLQPRIFVYQPSNGCCFLPPAISGCPTRYVLLVA